MTRQFRKIITAFKKQQTTNEREQGHEDVIIHNEGQSHYQPLSAETKYENHGASLELH